LHTARKLFKTEFAKVILRGNKKYFPLKESWCFCIIFLSSLFSFLFFFRLLL
jgi:hypothetical protein